MMKSELKSTVKVKDILIVEVRDKYGNVKYRKVVEGNSLTNAGLAELAKLCGSGLGGTAFGYIAIGTGGDTAFDPSQTALSNEVKRKSATVSTDTTNVTDDTTVFQAEFSSEDGLSGTQTINEVGIFNSDTGGTMLNRFDQNSINVTLNWDAGDKLDLTIKVVFST